MKDMLTTSGVGVRTAAMTAVSRMAYLRFRDRKAEFTILISLSRARMSGSSKVRPKPKMKMEQKDTYFPTERSGCTSAVS